MEVEIDFHENVWNIDRLPWKLEYIASSAMLLVPCKYMEVRGSSMKRTYTSMRRTWKCGHLKNQYGRRFWKYGTQIRFHGRQSGFHGTLFWFYGSWPCFYGTLSHFHGFSFEVLWVNPSSDHSYVYFHVEVSITMSHYYWPIYQLPYGTYISINSHFFRSEESFQSLTTWWFTLPCGRWMMNWFHLHFKLQRYQT